MHDDTWLRTTSKYNLPPLPEPLPASTTDAHTHALSTQEYSGLPVAEALDLARAANVTRAVEVGTDVASSEAAVELAERYPQVVASVAIHPNDAARLGDRLGAELERLAALVGSSDRIRGVGETGLDYFRTTDPAGKGRQREAFAAHIAWARQHDLALVIHDRDAHADILDVLDAEGSPERVQLHCFSGTPPSPGRASSGATGCRSPERSRSRPTRHSGRRSTSPRRTGS